MLFWCNFLGVVIEVVYETLDYLACISRLDGWQGTFFSTWNTWLSWIKNIFLMQAFFAYAQTIERFFWWSEYFWYSLFPFACISGEFVCTGRPATLFAGSYQEGNRRTKQERDRSEARREASHRGRRRVDKKLKTRFVFLRAPFCVLVPLRSLVLVVHPWKNPL